MSPHILPFPASFQQIQITVNDFRGEKMLVKDTNVDLLHMSSKKPQFERPQFSFINV